MLKKRKELPVYNYKKEILDVVKNNRVVIIRGATGCGKTTQVMNKMLTWPLTLLVPGGGGGGGGIPPRCWVYRFFLAKDLGLKFCELILFYMTTFRIKNFWNKYSSHVVKCQFWNDPNSKKLFINILSDIIYSKLTCCLSNSYFINL